MGFQSLEHSKQITETVTELSYRACNIRQLWAQMLEIISSSSCGLVRFSVFVVESMASGVRRSGLKPKSILYYSRLRSLPNFCVPQIFHVQNEGGNNTTRLGLGQE